jgi:D-threo-aldose 1-dehydrogenase
VSRPPRETGGVALGPLGLGGAPLGNLYEEIAEGAAVAAVRRAYAAGIRHFDTAPHYGHGLSEHRIGEALRGIPRDSFVLSTKVGRRLSPDPRAPAAQHGFAATLPFVQRWDYSADGARRSLEDSLQRLGMARVDIAYVHDCDAAAHGADAPAAFRAAMEGALPALAGLRRQGVVGAIGLGVNLWQTCRDALAHADIDLFLLAGRYTLLDQSALPELLPLCVARGAGIVVGGPYNSGILATGAVPGATFDYRPAPPAILERVRAIEAACGRHGVPLKAAALQFPLAHPAVVAVIPGARTPAEVDANVALMREPIPAAFWAELRETGLLPREAPTPA